MARANAKQQAGQPQATGEIKKKGGNGSMVPGLIYRERWQYIIAWTSGGQALGK